MMEGGRDSSVPFIPPDR
jgi:hypothetical protein